MHATQAAPRPVAKPYGVAARGPVRPAGNVIPPGMGMRPVNLPQPLPMNPASPARPLIRI